MPRSGRTRPRGCRRRRAARRGGDDARRAPRSVRSPQLPRSRPCLRAIGRARRTETTKPLLTTSPVIRAWNSLRVSVIRAGSAQRPHSPREEHAFMPVVLPTHPVRRAPVGLLGENDRLAVELSDPMASHLDLVPQLAYQVPPGEMGVADV